MTITINPMQTDAASEDSSDSENSDSEDEEGKEDFNLDVRCLMFVSVYPQL